MDSPSPTSASLLDWLLARLAARPDHCAIRFNGASISNAQLLGKAGAIAEALNDVGAGTRVGACLERGPAVPALLLALWLRGLVYVPLDPQLPRARLYTMCEVAEIDLVVTQAALRGRVDRLPCQLRELEEPGFGAPPLALAPLQWRPALPPDSLAYILFTSGSSGTPKGVQITHTNLTALFSAVHPLLQLASGSRILGCASLAFDISFFELLAPVLCSGTLVLADAAACTDPRKLLQLAEREKVTVIQATPARWRLLAGLPWTTRIATALATGEPLMRDTAAAILDHAETLWNLYGPTECTLWASAQRVTAADLAETAPAIVSIGCALPGYGLQLDHTSANATEAAELVISGPGVGAGYCGQHGSPAFTQAAGVPRRYHSGDLCLQDACGRFHYVGRRDSQAKHDGYRIEPDEIALLLRQHMAVRDAVCLVRPATDARPSLLFACVTFRTGMPQRDKTALNAWLADRLPAWMLPQRYFFLEQLPQTANGKLDRSALLALTTQELLPAQHGELAAQVADVFCEVLDIPKIGPCDSFLDAGGSSMLAATLVLTLNARLGSRLTLRQALSVPPTVSSIVQLLQEASSAS